MLEENRRRVSWARYLEVRRSVNEKPIVLHKTPMERAPEHEPAWHFYKTFLFGQWDEILKKSLSNLNRHGPSSIERPASAVTNSGRAAPSLRLRNERYAGFLY